MGDAPARTGPAWRRQLARLTGVSGCPREDIGLGVAVAAFAGLLWWEALKVPPPFFDPLGSAAAIKADYILDSLCGVR